LKTLTNISLLLIAVIILFPGCGVYSFTGASVPAGAKTVSVQYFPNKAQLVEPILSPAFTNKLRDIFTTQTTLTMIESKGDLAIEGEIISYKTTPVAIQADQTAAMNRLTIVVNVRFVNKLEPEKDFEQKFSQFLEYPSESDLNTVSAELITAINEMLTTDIFNKAVVNW
jgi:hypothetical protein